MAILKETYTMCDGKAPVKTEEVVLNPDCAYLFTECDFTGDMVEICD